MIAPNVLVIMFTQEMRYSRRSCQWCKNTGLCIDGSPICAVCSHTYYELVGSMPRACIIASCTPTRKAENGVLDSADKPEA